MVSSDVYEKMVMYKRISSKSFSAFTNFCQFCSKPLDVSLKGDGNFSQYSTNMSPSSQSIALIDPKLNMETGGESNSHGEIHIFHCGHSFHQSCLEMMESHAADSLCPVCNSSSVSSFSSKGITKPSPSSSKTSAPNARANKQLANKLKQKQNQHNHKQQASLGSIDLSDINLNDLSMSPPKSPKSSSESPTENPPEQVASANYKLSLSESQIKALRSIRTRTSNVATRSVGATSQAQMFNYSVNTMLEKNSKLQLAPANLRKFME